MHGRGRLFTITLLLVFMPITRVNATTVGFRPPVEYPAGTDLRDVVVGDFNGDGNNDVGVANDGGISILLGNGDGTFQAATNLGAGKNPCPFHPCLVSTDFNGDGDLDLAVPNTDNTLSVLLGNGDGTFQPHVDYATGPGTAYSLRLGDVNGDQVVDLIMLRSGSFGILIGNGEGTFQNPVDVGTGSYSPQGLSVFDVDGDGKLDLVTTVGSSGVATLLGNGDGTFQAPIVCSCGVGPGLSAQDPTEGSDFNEDGHMDLAIRLIFNDLQHNSFYAEEVVLLGNGDGTFQDDGHFVHTSGPAALLAGVADFSRDGHSDIAIVFKRLNALFGNGRGSFTGGSFSTGTGYTTSIAAGDINGDGFPDLIVTNYGLNVIRVLINTAQPVPVLTVTLSGNGSGSVTSSPSGIECPGTCLSHFDVGTVVSLTATESNGSTFAGWSGACSNTGACNVTMNADQNVTATFTTPDFSASAAGPVPASIVAGQSASSTVSITSVGGFTSAVQLTCSVSPAPALAPACSFNPSSLTPPVDGSLNSILTLTTNAPTMALTAAPGLLYALWLPVAGLALAGIGSRERKRKRLLGCLFFALLFAGVFFQTSCGGGSSDPPGGNPGTPRGQYTITVTGTSGSLQHSTTVVLTVQ